MKKIYLLLLTICLFTSVTGIGQVTLISPTGDGGFETGTTFGANGWVEVQPGSARQWWVGNAPTVFAGARCAYVGSNSAYNGSSNGTVMHFYRDVTIPAGATNVSLSFYYKQTTTDNTWDYFYVFTTTTAQTPVVGTVPGTGYTQRFSNTATAYTSWTLQTIDLTALAGTTVRLVFTHKNDGNSPYGNPAVDNISLVYTPASPKLVATALTAFGNICTNTTAGPNSFALTGTNLTGNVTVNGLAGYSYSTTSGGTYASTLTLVPASGNVNQTVYVKFTPTLVQSYNGNISISGGGATAINVVAAGTGVNSPPTATSGSVSNITNNSATVAGSLTAGCGTVSAYGIEYSTVAGFANGSGTAVTSTNLAGGTFTSSLSGLAASTLYYFHAYAIGSTTAYGAQGSFTTAALTYKDAWVSMNLGAANWCAGETRTVSVTVTNTGTATWTDASPDINIGVKWNADADYNVRVDAGGLLPGSTQTYSLTITAPATTGTNNLTFDVVEEGVSWFANNAGGTGPGNVVYKSAAQTINIIPAAVTVNGAGTFCGSTTITSSGGTGGTIYFQGTTSGGTSTATPSSSQSITTSGTYYFRASSSCGWGAEGSVTVVINPLPAATTVSGAGTFCTSTTVTASNGGDGTMYFEGTVSGGTSTTTPSTSQLITASGTYYFRARSAAGCWGAEGSVVIVIKQVPTTAAAGPDQVGSSTCGVTSVTLAANNPASGTGVWSVVSGTGGSFGSTTVYNTSFTGVAGSTYVLRWTISNSPCAVSADDVTVTFNIKPTATTSTTPVLCFAGSTGTATVVGSGGTPGYTYLWSNGQTTATAVNLAAGTYNVTVTDSKGCNVTVSAVVSQPTALVADAGGNQNICAGSSTVLGAFTVASGGTGAYTYSWAPAAGLSPNAATARPTTPAISTTTGYTVTVTDGNGCTATSSASIAVGTVAKSWNGVGVGSGTGDDNFNEAQNWSPKGVPGACNDVSMVFDGSGILFGNSTVITIAANTTIKSLATTVSGTGLFAVSPTLVYLYTANNKSFTVTGNTSIATNMNFIATILNGYAETNILAGTGSVITYGGTLTTTVANGNNNNYPLESLTNNTGIFYINGNANLGGIGNDYGNKPAQVIFNGTTGATQTISNNSGAQAIYLGATSTDIGQTNSPIVVLAGAGTGGYISVGNLNVNNVSTLDLGAVQTINRYNAGGSINLAAGSTMKLGKGTGGVGNSNFPSLYSAWNLNATSTVEYNGIVAQNVFNTPVYGNLVVSGASTKTASGALTIKGNATINSSSILAGSTFTHTISGNWSNNVSTAAFTSAGTVTFNGSAPQTIGGTSGTAFNSLTISNSTGVSLSQDQSVAALPTISLGLLTLGSNNLTMGATAADVAGAPFSSTKMIVASGTGEVRKLMTGNGTYTFPIGDNSGTTEYSPLTLSATGSAYSSAYIGVNVADAKHVNNYSPVNFLTRYWNVKQTGITSCLVNLTGSYIATSADINGTEASISSAQLKGTFDQASNGWIKFSPLGSGLMTVTGASLTSGQANVFSGITGANPTVSITAGLNPTICQGTSVNINTAVTGDPGFVYSWSPATALSSATISSPVATPSSTTTYTLTAKDINGVAASVASTTITVNIPASISTQPTDFAACSGGPAAFTVSAAGTGIVYQWQVSTDNGATYNDVTGPSYLNATTNTLLSPAPDPTMNDNLYRVIVKGTSPCGNLISNPVRLTIRNVWVGNTSSDWNDAANWSGNTLPGTSCAVVNIPVRAHQPVLSSGIATINSLVIANTATVTVNNASLQIAGAISGATGSINIASGTLELNGTSSQVISGSMFSGNTVKNLTLSNSAGITLSAGGQLLNITGTVGFGNKNNVTFTTNDNLVLKSSVTTTADYADNTNNGVNSGNSITGNVSVERYINTGTGAGQHGKGWQLLSAPTNGQTIKDSWMEGGGPLPGPHNGYGTIVTGVGGPSNGFDIHTPTPSMKWFSATANTWVSVSNPSTTQINYKPGYLMFVRGDRSVITSTAPAVSTILRTKGTLNQGTQPAVSLTPNSFEVVGNPFASPVLFSKIVKTNTEQGFTVWDPSLNGSYNLGGYQAIIPVGPNYVVVPGGTMIYPETGLGGNYPYIQSGQAFFIRTLSGPASVQFAENQKAGTGGNHLVMRGSGTESTPSMLSTTLYAVNGSAKTLSDGNLVLFDASYADGIDSRDQVKIPNDGENFGIKRYSNNLIVEGRPSVTQHDTIFYNMSNLKQQAYKLVFVPQDMDASLSAELVDKFTATRTAVSLTDSSFVPVSITADAASKAADRFMLVFNRTAIVLPVTITSVSADRNADRTIAIKWKVDNELNIMRYDVQRSAEGTSFTSIITTGATAINGGTASYGKNDLSPLAADNYYRIKATGNDGKVQYSAVVRVAPLKVAGSISVYPNPVVDKTVQVQFINQRSGTYRLELSNKLGQVVYSGKAEVTGSTFVKAISLGSLTSAGAYQLKVTDEDGKLTVQQMIVE